MVKNSEAYLEKEKERKATQDYCYEFQKGYLSESHSLIELFNTSFSPQMLRYIITDMSYLMKSKLCSRKSMLEMLQVATDMKDETTISHARNVATSFCICLYDKDKFPKCEQKNGIRKHKCTEFWDKIFKKKGVPRTFQLNKIIGDLSIHERNNNFINDYIINPSAATCFAKLLFHIAITCKKSNCLLKYLSTRTWITEYLLNNMAHDEIHFFLLRLVFADHSNRTIENLFASNIIKGLIQHICISKMPKNIIERDKYENIASLLREILHVPYISTRGEAISVLSVRENKLKNNNNSNNNNSNNSPIFFNKKSTKTSPNSPSSPGNNNLNEKGYNNNPNNNNNSSTTVEYQTLSGSVPYLANSGLRKFTSRKVFHIITLLTTEPMYLDNLFLKMFEEIHFWSDTKSLIHYLTSNKNSKTRLIEKNQMNNKQNHSIHTELNKSVDNLFKTSFDENKMNHKNISEENIPRHIFDENTDINHLDNTMFFTEKEKIVLLNKETKINNSNDSANDSDIRKELLMDGTPLPSGLLILQDFLKLIETVEFSERSGRGQFGMNCISYKCSTHLVQSGESITEHKYGGGLRTALLDLNCILGLKIRELHHSSISISNNISNSFSPSPENGNDNLERNYLLSSSFLSDDGINFNSSSTEISDSSSTRENNLNSNKTTPSTSVPSTPGKQKFSERIIALDEIVSVKASNWREFGLEIYTTNGVSEFFSFYSKKELDNWLLSLESCISGNLYEIEIFCSDNWKKTINDFRLLRKMIKNKIIQYVPEFLFYIKQIYIKNNDNKILGDKKEKELNKIQYDISINEMMENLTNNHRSDFLKNDESNINSIKNNNYERKNLYYIIAVCDVIYGIVRLESNKIDQIFYENKVFDFILPLYYLFFNSSILHHSITKTLAFYFQDPNRVRSRKCPIISYLLSDNKEPNYKNLAKMLLDMKNLKLQSLELTNNNESNDITNLNQTSNTNKNNNFVFNKCPFYGHLQWIYQILLQCKRNPQSKSQIRIQNILSKSEEWKKVFDLSKQLKNKVNDDTNDNNIKSYSITAPTQPAFQREVLDQLNGGYDHNNTDHNNDSNISFMVGNECVFGYLHKKTARNIWKKVLVVFEKVSFKLWYFYPTEHTIGERIRWKWIIPVEITSRFCLGEDDEEGFPIGHYGLFISTAPSNNILNKQEYVNKNIIFSVASFAARENWLKIIKNATDCTNQLTKEYFNSKFNINNSLNNNSSSNVHETSDTASTTSKGTNRDKKLFFNSDKDKNTCFSCSSSFTLYRWRHRCHRCSQWFCSKCCKMKKPIPECGVYIPVRHCQSCFKATGGENSEVEPIILPPNNYNGLRLCSSFSDLQSFNTNHHTNNLNAHNNNTNISAPMKICTSLKGSISYTNLQSISPTSPNNSDNDSF